MHTQSVNTINKKNTHTNNQKIRDVKTSFKFDDDYNKFKNYCIKQRTYVMKFA
jgi:hypothetical protein